MGINLVLVQLVFGVLRSHPLPITCEAFANIAAPNLTESDREKYIQQSYRATGLHAKALDKCESLISSLSSPTCLDLRKYPNAIATLQLEINQLDLEVSILQGSLRLVEYDIDQQIAFDTSLTNDAKRKSMRTALLEMHPHYAEYEEKLGDLKNQRQLNLIELDRLLQEFAVAKLEARERIARLEASM